MAERRRAGTKARIAFKAADLGGAGRIRSFYPGVALAEAGWNVVHSHATYPPLGAADILVVHRPLPESQSYRDELRRSGTLVLVQEDDDLTAVAAAQALDIGPEHEEFQLAHQEAIRRSDGLLVSTPRLLEVYGHLAPRSYLVPNHLPAWVHRLHEEPAIFARRWPGAVYVGWAGIVKTHRVDLRWLAPVSDRAMRGAVFSTIGDVLTYRALGLSDTPCDDTFVTYELHDEVRFYRLMARCDIGIVPLDPSQPLNWGKSSLKGQEFAALGKPIVATRTPEYERLVTHGVNGLLADTPEEFAEHLQLLIRDRALREGMALEAKRTAEGLTLEGNLAAWETPLREVWKARVRARAA